MGSESSDCIHPPSPSVRIRPQGYCIEIQRYIKNSLYTITGKIAQMFCGFCQCWCRTVGYRCTRLSQRRHKWCWCWNFWAISRVPCKELLIRLLVSDGWWNQHTSQSHWHRQHSVVRGQSWGLVAVSHQWVLWRGFPYLSDSWVDAGVDHGMAWIDANGKIVDDRSSRFMYSSVCVLRLRLEGPFLGRVATLVR